MQRLFGAALGLGFAGMVWAAPAKAVAVLHPTKDSSAKGVLAFTSTASGVAISGEISGLTPGTHGFHIHEFGDCSSADGAAAGSHYNPTAHPHAGPADARRHVGDLGNIEAGADGVAKVSINDATLAFDGPSSILGRGVIVHTKADDLKTQPTGNAGGRLACGVIGVAKGE